MPRPITVRLPANAGSSLSVVVERTQRPIAWLLTEALYDAARAVATTSTALDQYLAAPVGAAPVRTTYIPSEPATAVLAALTAHTGQRAAVVVRTAWQYWIDQVGVDDIVALSGGVRPARTGGVA